MVTQPVTSSSAGMSGDSSVYKLPETPRRSAKRERESRSISTAAPPPPPPPSRTSTMCPRDIASSSPSSLPVVSSPWNFRAFRALDLDGDGAIRPSDLSALFSSSFLHPSPPFPLPLPSLTPSDIAPMIAAADLDGDGAVDLAEFEQQLLLAQQHNGRKIKQTHSKFSSFLPPASALEDVFRMLDTNQDGFLSRDDLRSSMALCGQPLSEPELDAMLAAASGPGSSSVDFPSFSRFIVSLMT